MKGSGQEARLACLSMKGVWVKCNTKYWNVFCDIAGISGVTLALSLLPNVVFAQVIISEVMYDHPGSDSGQEWIELFNTGASAVDLTKWKVNDGANHVLNVPPKNSGIGSMVIAPGEYLVLASNAAQFEALYPSAKNVIDTSLSLTNAGGIISLVDASSTVKDTVSYAAAMGGAGDGNSLNRSSSDVPWIARAPTPGAAASATAIPPPPPKVVAQKSTVTSKKTTSPTSARAKSPVPLTNEVAIEGIQGHSSDSSSTETSPTPAADRSQVASAISIASFSWWWAAAAALAAIGAGAMFFSRAKSKEEWDIEEVRE